METKVPKTSERTSRKLKAMYFCGSMLLIGFAIAAYAKVDHNLYVIFASGVTAGCGVFTWGNVKTHEAQKQTNELPSSQPSVSP